MERLQKATVLTYLVDRLRQEGSWAGETHIQKAVFFLQELLGCTWGFDFILYMHGPFSFDLRDELTGLRASLLLDLEPQTPPYGAKFAMTDIGANNVNRHRKTLGRYAARIDFIAHFFGDKGIRELERLATALYASRELGWKAAVKERAKLLHEVKPHVPLEEALEAVAHLDRIREEVQRRDLDQCPDVH